MEEIREWINEGRADANTLVCGWTKNNGSVARPTDGRRRPAKFAPKITGASKTGDGTIQISFLPAILCTLFCCLPFGIAGIVFAAQANSKAQGD